jgi:hypothetical protein
VTSVGWIRPGSQASGTLRMSRLPMIGRICQHLSLYAIAASAMERLLEKSMRDALTALVQINFSSSTLSRSMAK